MFPLIINENSVQLLNIWVKLWFIIFNFEGVGCVITCIMLPFFLSFFLSFYFLPIFLFPPKNLILRSWPRIMESFLLVNQTWKWQQEQKTDPACSFVFSFHFYFYVFLFQLVDGFATGLFIWNQEKNGHSVVVLYFRFNFISYFFILSCRWYSNRAVHFGIIEKNGPWFYFIVSFDFNFHYFSFFILTCRLYCNSLVRWFQSEFIDWIKNIFRSLTCRKHHRRRYLAFRSHFVNFL